MRTAVVEEVKCDVCGEVKRHLFEKDWEILTLVVDCCTIYSDGQCSVDVPSARETIQRDHCPTCARHFWDAVQPNDVLKR